MYATRPHACEVDDGVRHDSALSEEVANRTCHLLTPVSIRTFVLAKQVKQVKQAKQAKRQVLAGADRRSRARLNRGKSLGSHEPPALG